MRIPLMAALAAPVLLGACTTTTAPVDVTRFHAQNAPQAETVRLAPARDIDAAGMEYRTYANAVAAQLARSGFTVVDPGQPAALIASVDFDTAIQRPYDARRSPVSVGVGGGGGSYGGGFGLGVGIDLSGPPQGDHRDSPGGADPARGA